MELASRGVYRTQVTKIVNRAGEYLNSAESRASNNAENLSEIEEELATYIERLTAAKESLKRANEEVKPLIKREDYEKEMELIAEYEDKAIGMLARLKKRLEKICGEQNPFSIIQSSTMPPLRPSSTTSTNTAKLPKLALRIFSGDVREWLPFWERFRTAVHDRADLTGADKFNYLQNHLKGRAAESIAGYTPNEANYEACISLLREEYGDKEKLIEYTTSQLMRLPRVVSSRDSAGLRKLYNHVVTNIRSLNALGVAASQYSIILRVMLLKALPSELSTSFHRGKGDMEETESENSTLDANATEKEAGANADISSTKAGSESSTCCGDSQMNQILKFLKTEVEALERSGVAAIPANREQHYNRNITKTTAGLLISTKETNSAECFFCKSPSHLSEICTTAIPISERKEMLKREGRCFRCTLTGHRSKLCKRKVKCNNCGGKHATAICDPAYQAAVKAVAATNTTSKNTSAPVVGTQLATANLFSPSTDAAESGEKPSVVFLQTAGVMIANVNERASYQLVRAILDGGSQKTYIKESVVKRLKLNIFDAVNIRIMTFGCNRDVPIKTMNRVKIVLKSQYNNQTVTVLAVVVPEICSNILPVPSCTQNTLNLLFADKCHRSATADEIGLLIGADIYWKVVLDESRKISDSLRAVNTIFGWTLHGQQSGLCDGTPALSASIITLHTQDNEIEGIKFDVERFWSLESIGISPPVKEDKLTSVDSYISKCGKRYMASLIWKNPDCYLHNYREEAFTRFQRLIKRLSKDLEQQKDYDRAMWELITAGIAEPCDDTQTTQRTYYMAHHPVYRPDKTTTKTRIVFDASGKAINNSSLNELLSPGPNLLGDLLAILLNFRVGKIAMVGDIEKAFLQILLSPEDKDVHRFFWFEKPLEDGTTPKIGTYRMCRLTFGVNCSPCLLSATLRKHLEMESVEFPETCKLLKDCFYMDDLAMSVDSYEKAARCFNEAREIFGRASMNIRKWNSNDEILCNTFGDVANISEVQKVLGVIWFVKNDCIAVDLDKVIDSIPINVTKRNLLQFLAKIYDPLGTLGPFTVKLKILFQETWRIKMLWDEPLPRYLKTTWEECVNGMSHLKDMVVPRCVRKIYSPIRTQLHIFCDASPVAYGAVAYIREEGMDGTITATYLCSKNRVAPLKKTSALSLPKMELTAAVIAARLLKYLTECLNITFDSFNLWSDSQITLNWICNGEHKTEPYINNRVKEIRQIISSTTWRYCPGEQNPADMLTRGVSGRKLQRSTTWFTGPTWLSEEESQWPQTIANFKEPDNSLNLYIREFTEITKLEPILKLSNFSQYKRLLRVTAYVLRFVNLIHGKRNDTIHLNAKEVEMAEIYWIKLTQYTEYKQEIDALRSKAANFNSSSILALNPITDENGILRVGSRLTESELKWQEIYPIILPKDSHFSSLIASYFHERALHGGVNVTLTKLREKFWIIKGRQLIKSTIYRCNVCRFLRSKPISQPFAPLPKCRLVSSKPFENTGLDFAGPLYVRNSSPEISTRKAYILLATCAVTRAVHLELVLDMTTETFMLALRRFFARRGVPKLILSDNAKTFKRASKELSQLANIIYSQSFQDFITSQGISWKFIVERAPWWGGFWERLVKIVKDLLKATIRREVLTTDQLQTYLVEAEYVINGRPLTYVGDDPHELSPLTPAHFLIGTFPATLASTTFEGNSSQDIRSKWMARLRLQQNFQRRFKTEYLSQLRSAHHNKEPFSKTIKIGDVVTYNDHFVPRHLWKLARVENLFVGRDGRARACELRLSSGTKIRRPVQHVYPLEIDDSSPGGGC